MARSKNAPRKSATNSDVKSTVRGSRVTRARKPKPAKPEVNEDTTEEEEAYVPEQSDEKVYDSDALDDDSDEADDARTKRKREVKPRSPRKKRRVETANEDDHVDLKEGQEIVGAVIQAPKTGKVPHGQISKNTFNFLQKLTIPECNDRQWFKLHEPVYRQAEQEWKDFVESFTDLLVSVDPQIPPLPPKDVITRIYRDIRFSNDKTPYKKSFSAAFSRSGRKGIFAFYYIAIEPGGKSMLGAGSYCPSRNELATMRSNILVSPTRLRQVMSTPTFIKYFGKPKKEAGKRQGIFGTDDELKVAPKGIDKNHKDIDLLKLRSFVVSHKFEDSEVLAPDFKDKLAEVCRVAQPFVHCLNDMMTLPTGAVPVANTVANSGSSAAAQPATDNTDDEDDDE